ncbi:hypothetical protein K474DRAFT_1642794 [Panus rudis PR-1116 ss-1]|nr:hypothetical protein K474DRAFT_1642794 [Panus rudis PR-1116 ss-1]
MEQQQQQSTDSVAGPSTSHHHAGSRAPRGRGRGGGGEGGGKERGPKLRGLPKDSEEVRISKTLSYILRHGAQKHGLYVRPDGYVRVTDLLALQQFRLLDFPTLQKIVQSNDKQRYALLLDRDEAAPQNGEIWWIRANQGHSIQNVELDLTPIKSIDDIPTKIAVHGTTRKAWESIRTQGLSKMNRNHIHLAQGVPGSGVISGMRQSSHILIYIDVQKALSYGIPFFLSANGVILSPGNRDGLIEPNFFEKVETKDGKALDWSKDGTTSGQTESRGKREGGRTKGKGKGKRAEQSASKTDEGEAVGVHEGGDSTKLGDSQVPATHTPSHTEGEVETEKKSPSEGKGSDTVPVAVDQESSGKLQQQQ